MRVQCPSCNVYLELPEQLHARLVCCSLCRHTFKLPRRLRVPDDTISAWLYDPDHANDADDSPADSSVIPSPQDSSIPLIQRLRLVQLEQKRALLEFPADLLKSEEFRCSMPRVCVHCLGTLKLTAHLIVFAPQLRDSISLEAEHRAGQLTIPQDILGDLHGAKLLALLPTVPSVPAPGNLPMPYWVCDLCSGAGEISGQIQVNEQTGRGLCRLSIRNLQVAASFLAAAGGADGKGYARLREYLQRVQEDRWDALPSVVRHRLEQWYKPAPKERFLAYVPDRDFSRTEDGMAGLIVTDRRLVCHRSLRHQEAPATAQLLLEVRHTGHREVVTISASDGTDCRQKSITLDRGGVMLLRRALSEAKFKAVWR